MRNLWLVTHGTLTLWLVFQRVPQIRHQGVLHYVCLIATFSISVYFGCFEKWQGLQSHFLGHELLDFDHQVALMGEILIILNILFIDIHLVPLIQIQSLLITLQHMLSTLQVTSLSFTSSKVTGALLLRGIQAHINKRLLVRINFQTR